MLAVLVATGAAAIAALFGFLYLTNMPGSTSARAGDAALEAATAQRLRKTIEHLAITIGGRSAARSGSLERTSAYLQERLRSAGYTPEVQPYTAEGLKFENIQAVSVGTKHPERIVVIGAHYDTAGALPGANDNGSGVAAVLELAERLRGVSLPKTVRWVFFANEEPPWFLGPGMGSFVYARGCKERGEKIDAMLSLETIGYYSDEPGSQKYPVGFHPGYPNTGNFLGFVSDVPSARLLRRVVGAFRSGTSLPSQGAAAPGAIPGVGWSDHWSFWQFGYRAVMVTDTAPYRYPWYHTAQDTPEKLNYDRMAQAISGLDVAIRDLTSN